MQITSKLPNMQFRGFMGKIKPQTRPGWKRTLASVGPSVTQPPNQPTTRTRTQVSRVLAQVQFSQLNCIRYKYVTDTILVSCIIMLSQLGRVVGYSFIFVYIIIHFTNMLGMQFGSSCLNLLSAFNPN